MPSNQSHHSDITFMSDLLDLDETTNRAWLPDEVGAVLRHQLNAPIEFDLSELDDISSDRVARLAAAHGLLVKSFLDVFQHQNPPVELLILTKQFAKRHSQARRSPLPKQVAMVLYYLSILTARVRLGQHISSLDDKRLCAGIERILKEGWVDETTKALLANGLEVLGQNEGANS